MTATCEVCKNVMTKGGCIGRIQINGKIIDRIPYGESGEWSEGRCGDCGVEERQLHHWGCDMERCPKCFGQALGCECGDDYHIVENPNAKGRLSQATIMKLMGEENNLD